MSTFEKRYDYYVSKTGTELILTLMRRYPKQKLIQLIQHHHPSVDMEELHKDYPTMSGLYNWLATQPKADLASLLADGFGNGQ